MLHPGCKVKRKSHLYAWMARMLHAYHTAVTLFVYYTQVANCHSLQSGILDHHITAITALVGIEPVVRKSIDKQYLWTDPNITLNKSFYLASSGARTEIYATRNVEYPHILGLPTLSQNGTLFVTTFFVNHNRYRLCLLRTVASSPRYYGRTIIN